MKKNKQLTIALSAFALTSLILLIVFYVSGVYPFGDRSLLKWDMELQYADFFRWWHRVLHGQASMLGYHYVQNPQSICHTQINLASIVQNKLQVFRYYKELYTKLGLYDQVQPQLYKFLTAFSENAYPSGSPQKIIMDMANHWGFGVLDASDKEKKHKTEPDA